MRGPTFFSSTAWLILGLMTVSAHAQPAEDFQWPHGAKVAVSLTYDDALNSQLDNVVPALDEHGFRGSFFLTLSSDVVQLRMDEWRAAAANGHELGNHSIFHPCRASKPGRDWVTPEHDLDGYLVGQMVEEVAMANTVLQAIDGRTARTFTPPCFDQLAGGENYVEQVKDLFVAYKGQEVESGFAALWSPSEVTGEQLINYVKEQAEDKKLLNILMHGVGGDHLAITTEAHAELLQYLADNRDVYWVDSYINIMNYVGEQRP